MDAIIFVNKVVCVRDSPEASGLFERCLICSLMYLLSGLIDNKLKSELRKPNVVNLRKDQRLSV
jgi:hypothetical protein